MPKLRMVPAFALAVAIIATGLSFPVSMNAIGFEKFDRFNSVGQAECLANMVQMTMLAFRNEGRVDLANQVDKLFTTTEPGDASPIGIVEVLRNVALARVADLKRFKNDPQAPRIQVEDALFVTLKKNNIFTEAMPDDALQLTAGFHNWTAADYVKLSEQGKKALVKGYVTLALPAYLVLDNVANKVASKEDSFSADDMKHLQKVTNQEFGSATGTSHDATGMIGFEKKMRDEVAKNPNALAFIAFLHFALDEEIADLQQQDTQLQKKAADIYDYQSIVMSDGRHVLPDPNGDFWVITRSIDDPMTMKLQGQDKIEAQRILACRQAGNSNCGAGNVGTISLDVGQMFLDALAKAAQDQRNGATTRPAAPPPAPAPQSSANPRAPAPAPPADDPIGEGGFITPPTTTAATAPTLVCVPPSLISQTWGHPVKSSKMDYFEGAVGQYVLSVAQPGWQYWVLAAAYTSFDPYKNADSSKLVRAVAPRDQPNAGTCPAGYAGFNVHSNK